MLSYSTKKLILHSRKLLHTRILSIENTLVYTLFLFWLTLLWFLIEFLFYRNPELDIENRKRKSRPAELVDNVQADAGTVKEKKNKTLDIDNQIIKKKKKKKSSEK